MHESLCDYLLELARNAVEAAATRVDITVEETEGTLRASVADNGRGMSEAERARCLDPFGTAAGKHPERRTGLGLPLLEAALAQADGTLRVECRSGNGTCVTAEQHLNSPDALPTGSIPDLCRTLAAGIELCHWRFTHQRNCKRYSIEFTSDATSASPAEQQRLQTRLRECERDLTGEATL